MSIITEKVTTVNALMSNQPWLDCVEDDGEICFASPKPQPKPPVIIVLDELDAMITDLEQHRQGTWKPMIVNANYIPNDDMRYAELRENDSIGREECSGAW